MGHFYGTAYSRVETKDFKDFTPLDWVVFILFWTIVVAAIVQGCLGLWGSMTITVGVAIIWIDVIFHVIMRSSDKVLYLFDGIGLCTIIGGVLVVLERFDLLIAYGALIYLIVCFGVGILCLVLASRKKKKIATYSREVEAVCETVDVRRTNLFRFDDITSNPFHEINQNEIYKPGFHYYLDGEEYFTVSTVYYGDMNTGYQDGKTITLRVNPRNPEDVLPKNEGYGMELMMGISWIVIGFISIGVGALVLLVI